MSDKLTFLGLTEKLTRQEKRPLSPGEVWANAQATLNKLTMNKDIRELLTRINNDLQTNEFIEEKYDKVLDLKGLSLFIKKKS